MRFELACVLAVAACSPEVLPHPDNPSADRKSLDQKPPADAGALVATKLEHEIANNYMAALSAPDFAGLDALIDEEAHFVFVGNKLDSHGQREIHAAHDKLFGGFVKRTFAARRVLITDRTQSIEWTMTGEDKTTHKSVGIVGIALVWTKDDGTVKDLHLYFDETVVHAQAGHGPTCITAPPPLPAAPSGPPEVVEQAHAPDEASNVKIVSDVVDTYLQNDEAKYVAAMTTDVEVVTLESATPMRGQSDARAYYQQLHKSIGDIDTQLLPPPLAAGDYVALEYRIVGEMRGRISCILNLGRLITMYGVDVVQMRGTKIARIWRYDDPLQIVP